MTLGCRFQLVLIRPYIITYPWPLTRLLQRRWGQWGVEKRATDHLDIVALFDQGQECAQGM
jgi:hypothetical protein